MNIELNHTSTSKDEYIENKIHIVIEELSINFEYPIQRCSNMQHSKAERDVLKLEDIGISLEQLGKEIQIKATSMLNKARKETA